MYRIYHGVSKKTPVTKFFNDEDKAQLACNVLYAMGSSKDQFGNSKICISVDGVRQTIMSDSLTIRDEEGNDIDRRMDREWFLGASERIKEDVLDRNMEQLKLEGQNPDRDYESENQKKYSVVARADDEYIHIVPDTWDPEKSHDVAMIAKYGMGDNIEFFKDGVKLDMGYPLSADVIGEHVFTECPEWIEDNDFADAVASIPDSSVQMEQ